jgi:Uma2 family endonuclease
VTDFVPGLELARAFYHDVLAQTIGPTPHAAALLGEGSEVLGFDTERSTDHAWGPRAQIFVEANAVESLRSRVDSQLPETFRGWPVRYFRWQTSQVEHHVEVHTLNDWLTKHLGFDPSQAITTSAWLATPRQLLLEVTSGMVFHDDSGRLTRIRTLLNWYPNDVWLWLMASQWHLIVDKESFIGRIAEVRDELGSRLLAARLAQDAVHLCFLQERKYAPYAKWLGTAFARLDAALDVGPVLHDVLTALDFDSRECALIRLFETLARRHNALGVTAPLTTTSGPFEVGINDAVRPYPVLDADRFAQACLESISDASLRRLPLVGSYDQLTDPTDLMRFTEWPRQVAAIYERQLTVEPDRQEQVTSESLGHVVAPVASIKDTIPMTAQRAFPSSNILAPWAEIVSGVGPVTVDGLLTLPEDGCRYEVVEGVLVRVAGSGDLATNIAAVILAALLVYVRPRQLGRVTGADGVYRFPGAETGLIPDVGFYGFALYPHVVDRNKPIPFAPELAIEVASPDQTTDGMAAKAQRYLQGGTRLVWIVWPIDQGVDIWHPGHVVPTTTLHSGDMLDGEAVVPGFLHPIADIFDV